MDNEKSFLPIVELSKLITAFGIDFELNGNENIYEDEKLVNKKKKKKKKTFTARAPMSMS
jgi:hypothetical protein